MNEEKNNLRKENKRQTLTLSIIAIITLLLVVVGATYAFFASQNTGKQDVNINAESGTTDVLSFSLNDKDVTSDQVQDEENDKSDIMITANMDNFNEGNISVGDGVTGTATLIANNATNNAKDNYYVYLNIAKNELRYTNFKNEAGEILEGKEEDGKIVAPDSTHTTKVPELILTVTQPDDKGELTQIDGLEYKTDVDGHGLNGFDITEATGLIPIAKNYEITATGDTPTVKATQEWEIKVTLVNLDSNQNKNTGKEFSGKLILQKDVIPTNLADVCDSNEKSGDCIKELYEQSEYSLSHVIYHNNTALAESQIPNATLNANDNSYRYSGSSEEVKNYVCLDGTTTENECSSDADLYRIIGFFPNESGEYEMKLIKYDYATKDELGDNSTAEGGAYYDNYSSSKNNYKGNNAANIAGYYWNYTNGEDSSNMWQKSNLNQINLNQFYLSYITTKVSNLGSHITEHDWTTGGFPDSSSYSSSYNAQQVYNKELGEEKLQAGANNCYDDDYNAGTRACKDEDLTYPDEIGLMYLSDYGYAAYPNAWNQTVDSSSGYGSEAVKTNNWMYMGLFDWTVSRNSDIGDSAWRVDFMGYANNFSVSINHYGVRPVFYLDSSTKIDSGDGSKTNPFRLSWN